MSTKPLIITIPNLEHFQYGHTVQQVKNRRAQLETVKQELCKVDDWLQREIKYLHDNCLSHRYKSTGDHDGSSQDWCYDCGKIG